MRLKMQFRAERVCAHACTLLQRVQHYRLGSAVLVVCTPLNNAYLAEVVKNHGGYYDKLSDYDEALLDEVAEGLRNKKHRQYH